MKIILTLSLLLSFISRIVAQEAGFSNNSIKTGLGIGIHQGKQEKGMGFMMSVGYQKTLKNSRIRINPDFMSGTFGSGLMLHTRDQYYRLSSAGINGYIDALKYQGLSLCVGTGVSLNYARGLLGTGGGKEFSARSSEYFYSLYYAGNLTAGLRINSPHKRLAYTLTPVDIHIGNKLYLLGMWKFDIEIKLKAHK